MERELLLLGLLRGHDMHGYQLNEMIDHLLGASIQLTKPTAYRLLGKMEEEGWIECREEREGNRPPRRVYTITDAGERAFQRLLRSGLGDYEPCELRSGISLAFLSLLPVDEALSLLSRRRAAIEKLLREMRASDEHHGGFQLVIDYQTHHLDADLQWVRDLIKRTEVGL